MITPTTKSNTHIHLKPYQTERSVCALQLGDVYLHCRDLRPVFVGVSKGRLNSKLFCRPIGSLFITDGYSWRLFHLHSHFDFYFTTFIVDSQETSQNLLGITFYSDSI